MGKAKIGIIGGAGYTAGELLRLLALHPKVDVTWVQSESQHERPVSDIHPDLLGDYDQLHFTSEISEADVVFLCKGHGESEKILAQNELRNTRIIDLSQDFRLKGNHGFVYGLPELNRETIRNTDRVANPGCFATAIQLGILPAIRAGWVQGDIHVSGITGSTGAGQQLTATSHFSWRNNNISVYKPFVHQHLDEIQESVRQASLQYRGSLHFIPYRGNFTRGIIITSYFETDSTESELRERYCEDYQDHPFSLIIRKNPDIKMVVNTNKCLIYIQKTGKMAMIVSVIDNLIKGASGQAIQNMNLMLGWDETLGLRLKATAF